MAALQHTTGPIHLFVRFRGASTVFYLGTCEVAPEVTADPSYLPVMNDLRGRSKPHDKIYDGESHFVFATINRFDYPIWKRCREAISHDATLAALGFDGRVENGRLVAGVGDFELILLYDHHGTGAATVDLPQGRIYRSVVVGGYKESTQGTRVQTIAARFDCEGLYDAANRQYLLYSEDLSALTFTTN